MENNYEYGSDINKLNKPNTIAAKSRFSYENNSTKQTVQHAIYYNSDDFISDPNSESESDVVIQEDLY